MCYTQNIDSLERAASIPEHKVVEVHGHTRTASCTLYDKSVDAKVVRQKIKAGIKPLCDDDECGGNCKPDIVFFHERMPKALDKQMKGNMPMFKSCDLLLVLGTTLAVQPFASFINQVSKDCPRIFINLGGPGSLTGKSGEYDDAQGHQVGFKHNYRDVLLEGESDTIIKKLVSLCGWEKEFNSLIEKHKHSSGGGGGRGGFAAFAEQRAGERSDAAKVNNAK
jgi:NAD-dependent deacetylase sirtuin 2